ncbi:hypothetical protein ILUMI_21406 [Ignelater luminosus]|uniref:Uncharacterized protein n=1 Tax=Ignelater luminosus TaxID=2038154 RepID=A0A8K0CCJ7_IGNLU|nr:hypothetical protein ILUMI_21406 [Ignelater luminosus]
MSLFTNEEMAIMAIALDEDEEDQRKVKKRKWVHEAWQKRETEGEFHTLYKELLNDQRNVVGDIDGDAVGSRDGDAEAPGDEDLVGPGDEDVAGPGCGDRDGSEYYRESSDAGLNLVSSSSAALSPS